MPAANTAAISINETSQDCPENNTNITNDNTIVIIAIENNNMAATDLTPPPDRKDVGFNEATPNVVVVSECKNIVQSYECLSDGVPTSRLLEARSHPSVTTSKRSAESDQIQCNEKKKICKAKSNHN